MLRPQSPYYLSRQECIHPLQLNVLHHLHRDNYLCISQGPLPRVHPVIQYNGRKWKHIIWDYRTCIGYPALVMINKYGLPRWRQVGEEKLKWPRRPNCQHYRPKWRALLRLLKAALWGLRPKGNANDHFNWFLKKSFITFQIHSHENL